MAEQDLVIAATFTSDSDAAVARSALEEEGIVAVVAPGDAGGAFPHFQMLGSVRLLVRPEDLARAEEILGRKEPVTETELADEDSPAKLEQAELAVRGPRPPFTWNSVYAAAYTIIIFALGVGVGAYLNRIGFIDLTALFGGGAGK